MVHDMVNYGKSGEMMVNYLVIHWGYVYDNSLDYLWYPCTYNVLI